MYPAPAAIFSIAKFDALHPKSARRPGRERAEPHTARNASGGWPTLPALSCHRHAAVAPWRDAPTTLAAAAASAHPGETMQRIERTLLRWGDSMAPAMLGLGAAAFLGAFAGKWRWHGSWLWFIFCAVAFTALVGHWSRAVRERCIREAPLTRFLQRTLRETCPHLGSRDCELVEPGLRQFSWPACATQSSLSPCPRRQWTCCGTRSSCTPRPTRAGARTRWDFFCTTPRPKPWAPRLGTTTACAAAGTGHARKNPSTPQPPPPAPAVCAGRHIRHSKRVCLCAGLQGHRHSVAPQRRRHRCGRWPQRQRWRLWRRGRSQCERGRRG